jgi:hypothetical protein
VLRLDLFVRETMAASPALLLAGLALLLVAQAQPPSSMRPTPENPERPSYRVSWDLQYDFVEIIFIKDIKRASEIF